MRNIFLFVFVAIFGCSQNPVKIKSVIAETHTDTLYNNLMTKIESLKGDLLLSGLQNANMRDKINDLQNQIIKYHSDVIKLKTVESQLDVFVRNNNEFLKQMRDLSIKNANLIDSNNIIKDSLLKKRNENKDLILMNKRLQQSNKLMPVFVTAKGYAHSHKLFLKSSLIETDKADQIEYIEISFIFPLNNNIYQREYPVKVYLYDSKGITNMYRAINVNYIGIEKICSVMFNNNITTVNDIKTFDAGDHKIMIYIENDLVYTGNVKLW